MRLLELKDTSTAYLERHGVESARLTMELILAHVLEKTRMQIYLAFEEDIQEPTLAKLRPLVKQRAEGVPLEYLLGFKEFDGHKFKLTPDVLIPRPETEMLLEAIVPLVKADDPLPLVDVGTGSGILAVSLARRFPTVPVIALDISEAALAVARENGAGLANLTFQQSDLLSAWDGKAQLIVANLPYIPAGDIAGLSREVRKEPRLALDGGPDGTQLIATLIAQSAGRTRHLALEFGDGQADHLKSVLTNHGYEVTLLQKDLTARERILLGTTQHHG
ncbi:MAG: protein-(glutamine-N5) methyltransferase, release factor-specific [Verrucomicrobia bacterium Tous-C9LFEB]|nr:MAG: protein-(glutamine-N5) methyltransferase, release factor-specific [Verrucomicrobia bacterium Tous-C9LFEB]